MGEYYAGEITVGGPVRRNLIKDLCEAILDQVVFTSYQDDEPFRPQSEAALLDACDGVLELCDPEAPGGSFDDLENFLREHNIAYERHSSSHYDYDACTEVYRPGRGTLFFHATDEGNLLVPMEEVVAVRDALRQGDYALALQLADKACPEIPPLEPLTFVDA